MVDAPPSASPVTRNLVKIVVGKDKLQAMMILSQPEADSEPITVDEVTEALQAAKVEFGIKQEVIDQFVTEQTFDTPVEVAAGKPMEKGLDTQFEYLFKTDFHHSPVIGTDGRIDYRDLNFVQNVTKDSVLVRATEPTDGSDGVDVLGDEIKAPGGRQIPFNNGNGTVISEDGLELIAACDGAVSMSNGRVSVQDVLTINGDIDFGVGDIDCVGSVRISGSVNAGFTVKAVGDIEVGEDVQDATLEAGGNIFCKGGFFGNGEGIMRAGGDVTVRYAHGQKIFAGGDVNAGGELVGCCVTAVNNVRVHGHNGKIAGGEVKAGKEIRAADIGTDAGAGTVLTVAYDAGLMRSYYEAVREIERVKADSERVKEHLVSLYKLQMSGKLTAQQELVLTKLEKFRLDLPGAMESLTAQKTEAEEKIKERDDARIIAEDAIFPGVKVIIGVFVKEIDTEARAAVLEQDGFKVQMRKYDRAVDD